jgi:hypothetical protein
MFVSVGLWIGHMAQPSSGTTAFQPSLADTIVEAFSRISIRPTSLTAQHMRDAYMSANYLQSSWSARNGPNLWKVVLRSINLVQGQASYPVLADVTDILDLYLRLPPLTNQLPIDIVVTQISRTEYADQPNKTLQARPTTIWWDRLTDSQIYMWPVPDANGPYTLFYYATVQQDDATIPQGATPDIPYRFFDAFAAGLAAKLAVKYSPPAMIALAQQLAQQAWDEAADSDYEKVPWFISPAIDYYSRNS